MKKVAILQSNYIPWKGYFDIIASVDEFIIYDDVQFTKNDWRNRNKVKTPQGIQWITVPVGPAIGRQIRHVELKDSRWQIKHWKKLEANYRKAAYFEEISKVIKPVYLMRHDNLSALNRKLIEVICSFLNINTKITNSWDYKTTQGKNQRLIDLCTQTGATEYISGPAAEGYLDIELFTKSGISVSWFEYPEYSEYQQLWGDFTHTVSILDLIFNCGEDASSYMKYVN